MKKQNGEITIKDIFNIFLPKLWFIILVAVVSAATLGTLTSMKKDTFTSSCTFSMGKTPLENSDSSNTGINAAEIEAMRSMIESSAYILRSESFCQQVHMELVSRYEEFESVTVSQIQSMLSVTLLGEATFFSIQAKSYDPELSLAVAQIVSNKFPEAYMGRFAYAINIEGLDYPREASSPDGKNVVRNSILGFAAGALISALIVFVIVKFDVVIRNKEKIEENFHLPILGVIPRLDPDE